MCFYKRHSCGLEGVLYTSNVGKIVGTVNGGSQEKTELIGKCREIFKEKCYQVFLLFWIKLGNTTLYDFFLI
jgi:hypothetical protein